MRKITLSDIQSFKSDHEPFTVMTAYDFPFAGILDEAGVDVILVGDSLANAVLGLESTRDVTMDDMVYHAKAVCRAVRRSFVVGDMPYSAYQGERTAAQAVVAARRLLDAGCGAIKLEWFDRCLETVGALRAEGVSVMGHIGLTPQTADQSGGFRVRGKSSAEAVGIYNQALALEQAGCFALVLECVPDRVAKVITESLAIPTIGIGAGLFCDAQVLVMHDALGIARGRHPKFVQSFCDIAAVAREGVSSYIRSVKARAFPDRAHSYSVDDEEFQLFLENISAGRRDSLKENQT